MPIRVLPPDVAMRIAAGEVVERPASAAKELIDNAIDAGATRVSVYLEQSGLGLIRVTDDGAGIPAAELALALERHATSKLDGGSGLDAIATLGFRGEALPSLVAAADIDLTSRTATAAAGATVRARDGRIEAVRAAAAPLGTTVSVRDLFARQPARRKFLRTPAAEAGQVAQVVSHYALAYPEIAFTLSVDGRRSLSSPGSNDARAAAAAVYGAGTAAGLLEIAAETQACSVRGLIAQPSVTRASRSAITLFINRRWVQSRRLAYAVESGYETLLMTGRRPLSIIDITVDPAEVDVNVHPAKTEVRLRSEGEVFRLVQSAVRSALVQLAVAPGLRGLIDPPPAPVWRLPDPTALPQPVTPLPPVTGGEQPPIPKLVLPVLRVVGQAGSTYIITEGPEGLYLIDQHAAHERVLYERIVQARSERRAETQALLDPIAFEPSPAQAAMLAEYGQELAGLGFVLEPFGERALLLRAVPAGLAGHDPIRAVTEYLDAVLAEAAPVERAERAAMTLACHAAVRAGKVMTGEEMRELVRLLERAEAPRTCPHGRPTMIHVSAAALEREFGRR